MNDSCLTFLITLQLHLRRLTTIRRSVVFTPPHNVHVFICARIDFCNSLIVSRNKSRLSPSLAIKLLLGSWHAFVGWLICPPVWLKSYFVCRSLQLLNMRSYFWSPNLLHCYLYNFIIRPISSVSVGPWRPTGRLNLLYLVFLGLPWVNAVLLVCMSIHLHWLHNPSTGWAHHWLVFLPHPLPSQSISVFLYVSWLLRGASLSSQYFEEGICKAYRLIFSRWCNVIAYL